MTTWRDERRQDRLLQAQIDRDNKAAEAKARAVERKAAQDRRLAARKAAKKSVSAAIAWLAARSAELLLVPVIVAPAILSWTGMTGYGIVLYGVRIGWLLSVASEAAMWAFAFRAAILLAMHPGTPVTRQRVGIACSAAVAAGLNLAHGYTKSGLVTGLVMAVVSVSGIAVHQIVTAPPGRSRSARSEARAARSEARIERRIARKIRKARKEAVDAADVDLSVPGGRLVMPGESAPKPDMMPTLEALVEAVTIAVAPAVSRAVAAAIPEPTPTPAIEAPAVPVPELTAGPREPDTGASALPPKEEETAGRTSDQADTEPSPGTDHEPTSEADTDPTPVAAEPDSVTAELPPLNADTALPQLSAAEAIAEEVTMSVAKTVAEALMPPAIEPTSEADTDPTPTPVKTRGAAPRSTRRAAAPKPSPAAKVTALIEQQNPKLTNAQIADRAGVTERTIERRRAALKQQAENGNVVSIGERRKALTRLNPHPPPGMNHHPNPERNHR